MKNILFFSATSALVLSNAVFYSPAANAGPICDGLTYKMTRIIRWQAAALENGTSTSKRSAVELYNSKAKELRSLRTSLTANGCVTSSFEFDKISPMMTKKYEDAMLRLAKEKAKYQKLGYTFSF